MKPVLTVAAGIVLFAASSVMAQTDTQTTTQAGYAFDKPRVLAQQLVWGRLHGVRLLAIACRERGDAKATAAYLEWLESQSSPIAAAERTLSLHYFGTPSAPLEAIDAALNLRSSLGTPDDQIAQGCATLPEALVAPRNDLRQYYVDLRIAMERGDPPFQGIFPKGER